MDRPGQKPCPTRAQHATTEESRVRQNHRRPRACRGGDRSQDSAKKNGRPARWVIAGQAKRRQHTCPEGSPRHARPHQHGSIHVCDVERHD